MLAFINTLLLVLACGASVLAVAEVYLFRSTFRREKAEIEEWGYEMNDAIKNNNSVISSILADLSTLKGTAARSDTMLDNLTIRVEGCETAIGAAAGSINRLTAKVLEVPVDPVASPVESVIGETNPFIEPDVRYTDEELRQISEDYHK